MVKDKDGNEVMIVKFILISIFESDMKLILVRVCRSNNWKKSLSSKKSG